VARAYAGILGYVAWAVVFFRGVKEGGAIEGVALTAAIHLVVFAAIGAVIGWLATTTVDDAVRNRLAAEIAARTKPNTSPANGRESIRLARQ
jgi:hypothetical protein